MPRKRTQHKNNTFVLTRTNTSVYSSLHRSKTHAAPIFNKLIAMHAPANSRKARASRERPQRQQTKRGKSRDGYEPKRTVAHKQRLFADGVGNQHHPDVKHRARITVGHLVNHVTRRRTRRNRQALGDRGNTHGLSRCWFRTATTPKGESESPAVLLS